MNMLSFFHIHRLSDNQISSIGALDLIQILNIQHRYELSMHGMKLAHTCMCFVCHSGSLNLMLTRAHGLSQALKVLNCSKQLNLYVILSLLLYCFFFI